MTGKAQTYITRADLANAMGVDERQLGRWHKDPDNPLPLAIRGRGRGNPSQYDLAQVFEWFRRRVTADMVETPDGKVYDYGQERARLTHEQADKTALEVKELRRELVRVSVVRAAGQSMVAAFRARVLSLPSRLAQVALDATDLAEMQEEATTLVHEALDELSDDGLLAGIDDAIRRAALDSGSDETAAPADGEPVGGHVPEVKRGKRRRTRTVAN